MPNQEHLNLLKQGVQAWNRWREANPDLRPDLRAAHLEGLELAGANLSKADLHGAALANADLSKADLFGANLTQADLSGAAMHSANLMIARLNSAKLVGADLNGANLHAARLPGADLSKADLTDADLSDADLSGADLTTANLVRADLSGATLTEAGLSGAYLRWSNLTAAEMQGAILDGADLTGAIMVYTDLTGASLTRCRIFGISAWSLVLKDTVQSDLVITDEDDDATITLDSLEVAQFIYLLLNNEKIREAIDTIGKKAVLILGRFTPERKVVLDALRAELRNRGYLPILFDFEKPSSRNLTETVSTLAHLARFVIADLTDAKSIPQELQRVVPGLPSLPVQPILLASQYEYAMFKDFLDYPWVLLPYRYGSLEELLASLEEKVIAPAAAKAQEIEARRRALEKSMAE